MRNEAHRGAGAAEEGRATAERQRMQIDPVLVDQAQLGEALRDIGGRLFLLVREFGIRVEMAAGLDEFGEELFVLFSVDFVGFGEAFTVGVLLAVIDDGGGEAGEGGPVIAILGEVTSGRTLEVATTKPGVQIFTANSFHGSPFPRWGGICFETQFYPDSPNRPEFPSCLLRPGERYAHVTEFRFGVSD